MNWRYLLCPIILMALHITATPSHAEPMGYYEIFQNNPAAYEKLATHLAQKARVPQLDKSFYIRYESCLETESLEERNYQQDDNFKRYILSVTACTTAYYE